MHSVGLLAIVFLNIEGYGVSHGAQHQLGLDKSAMEVRASTSHHKALNYTSFRMQIC